MKRFFKIALFLLILLIGIGALAVYWTFYRPLPDYDATIELTELNEPVKIYWGPYGVPHIYAENKHDLYMALGYVHAQDRLWQMTLQQMAAQGRFAEFFGEQLLPIDKFQRTVGFWRIAQKLEKRLPDSLRQVLEAYSSGVNKYVAMNKKTLPIQFALTSMEPIPWTPTHTLAITRLMGWELNTAWKMELNYTLLSKKLLPRKLNLLFPDHPVPQNFGSTFAKSGNAFATFVHSLFQINKKYQQLMNISGDFVGSNAWAVSGSRTSSGKPLLAGDPHLGLSIPGKWYEVHLHLNGKNLSGATIPGAPAVILGQNDFLVWSFTNVMLDGTDFYKEIVHPADSTRYLVDSTGGEAVYEEFAVQREIIQVKDADDVVFTRKVTKHGPVVSRILLNQFDSENSVITMNWYGYEPSRELLALQKMGWAESFATFKEAVRHFKVPAQNVIYADTARNIALFTMARVPVRDGNPLLLRPGWKPEFDWQGSVPFEELPVIVNPEKGWVANANNQVIETPYYISDYWAPGSRYERIVRYLSNNNRLTAQAFQVMQYDVFAAYSQKLASLVLPILQESEGNFPVAVEYLRNWNYTYGKAESAATILDVFKLRLAENIFADEMGARTYQNFIAFAAKPARILLRFLRNGSPFFDNIQTIRVETQQEIVDKSMRQAINYLEERFGDEPADWRWENVHDLTLRPPFFGRAAESEGASEILKLIVENVMSKGPFGVAGSGVTINAGGYSWNSPFTMTSGASIRRIVDLSDTDRSLSILPTGQSGNPLSKYYGDQTRNWLNGQYKYLYQDSSLFTDYTLMRLVPKE